MYVSSICIWLWYDMYMNMYVYMLLRSYYVVLRSNNTT